MSGEEFPSDEDSLLTWLVACDKALAAGTPPEQPSGVETPQELRPRLQANLACIQALRQVLPRRAASLSPVEDLPFRQLGRFQVRRLLGQGAFGMVFLAADPQLGRDVALKVPRPDALLTGELRERFLREARAAAGLDHPNLVPVYESGSVGPFCFIASAYCPGITLSEWLKERAELAPLRLAAALVATLADAVGHAHTRGVIHRDLKPSNVLLQTKRRGAGDTDSTVQDLAADAESDLVPRITDFGLAKLTADVPAPPGETPAAETRTGAVLGTPNYMAPEQARGKNKEIGPAADIYALGAILYEMLTGQPPFRGETLLDILEQVRTVDPLPPGRLRPKLPRDLETICLKCLQKEPRKRYESAAALADDLRRYLAGEPIRARPIRVWERAMKWARRQPALALLLAVSMLGPLAFATVVLAYNVELATTNAQRQQANDELKKALDAKEEQQKQTSENFHFARLAIDDYATKVSQDDRLKAHDLEGLRRELLQSAVNFYHQFLKQRPDYSILQEEYAQACRNLGKLYRELGSRKEATEIVRTAVDTYKELVGANPNVAAYQYQLGVMLDNLAVLYSDLRRSNEAEAAFREAQDVQQKLVRDYPDVAANRVALADTLYNLGLLYEYSGRPDRAESALRKAQDLRLKLSREDPKVERYRSSLMHTHFGLGILYEGTSRSELAEESFSKACGLARELIHDYPAAPSYQQALAKALTRLGLVYGDTGRPDPAVKAYREAESIYQKLSNNHPKVLDYLDNLARVHHNLGQTYQLLGQSQLAETAYGKARDLRKQLIHNQPAIPDYRGGLALTLLNLGGLFCDTGRSKDADVPLGEARVVLEKLVHDYPSVTYYRVSLGNTYSSLGLMEGLQGNNQAAFDQLKRAVEMLEAILKLEPRQTFARQCLNHAYQQRVAALGQLGRYEDALHDLDRLLELAGGVKTDPWRLQHAEALAWMGQHGSAMTEVNELGGRSSLSAENLYNLARVSSLCSADARRDTKLPKPEQDSRAERYAARAIEFLKRAKAAGYFQPAARIESLRKDKDLDALRQRKDFQALLQSLQPKGNLGGKTEPRP